MTSPAGEDSDYVIPGFFANPVLRPYLKNIRNWQGYIRFLGLPDRRENPDIVIDRLFVSPLLTRRYVSSDENPNNWIDEAETLIDALAENSPLVLLGDPGIGKSTLLNQVAWLLSRPATNALIEKLGWRLPLPMVLRELPIRGVTDFDGLLEAFLSHEMSAPLREERGQRYLNEMLAEGKAFLLLDGIDEISDRQAREDLRKAVFDGFSRFPDCRWLLSSRIVGYDEVPFDRQRIQRDEESPRSELYPKVRENTMQLHRHERDVSAPGFGNSRLVTCYIAPFDDSRIAAFAKNWYTQRDAATQRARTSANHLVRAVHADDSILRLARIPNLLTMMALIHRIEATLPHGRALLYGRIAEAYLESIDKFRGIDSSPHDLSRKKAWLARVGFEMQRLRTPDHPRDSTDILMLMDFDTVLNWLNEEMVRGNTLANLPSAREFLNILARRSGLFLPRGEGQYAFVHLSFQEYFAAVVLAREVTRLRWARNEESRLQFNRSTVACWAGTTVWRETFAFLFELLASEEEDDWHEDLCDCVFGTGFSRLEGSESKEETKEEALNLGRLLARLVVNSQSGLSSSKRREAIACCVKTQLRLQRTYRNMDSSIFKDLIRDDTQLYEDMFNEIAAQMQKPELGKRSLILNGCQVSDLSPLAKLSTLEFLSLSNTQVSDLSPLAKLSTLKSLDLLNTQVSDLSPLAKLPTLKFLDLNYTQVSDLSPLAKLSTLKFLFLSDTQVSDLSPLAKLPTLKFLDLFSTQVSDLSPLAKLSELNSLDLLNTQVSDLSPLAKLSALNSLNLSDTQVSDLSPLAKLSTLKSLDLSNTQNSDLSPLAKLSTLKSLNLLNTQVSDLSPLAKLSALKSLDLNYTQVSDLSPLAKLSALNSLNLSNTQVSDLSPLAKLSALKSLNLSNTQVSDLSPLAKLSTLKFLSLMGTQVSADVIDKLRTDRPDLKIISP